MVPPSDHNGALPAAGDLAGTSDQIMTVVMQYFGTLREEIHLRIKEHTHLVWIKLAVLGGMISFLITKLPDKTASGSPVYYFVWLIPLTAAMFDLLIAGNLRVIYNLGYYIKNYLEGNVLPGIRGRLVYTLQGREKTDTVDWLHDAAKESVGQQVSAAPLLKALIKKLGDKRFSDGKWEAKVHERGPNEWKLACSQAWPAFRNHRLSWFKHQFGMGKPGSRGAQVIIADEADGLNVYYSCLGYWEENAAQAAPKYRCYTCLDMLAIWLFTVGGYSFSFVLRWEQAGTADVVLAVLCAAFALFAVVELWRSITMERGF